MGLWGPEVSNRLHGERVWFVCCRLSRIRRRGCRSSELSDELVTNGLSRDGGLVPAKPAVEVSLLELLADVVDGDVLRAFRPTPGG
jgi:hypothetical protein